MKRQISLAGAAGLALAAALAGCTTMAPAPVEVTRFHLGAPLERGTITVEPVPGYAMSNLEFQTYANAVQAEAGRSGFAAAAGDVAQYVAAVGFRRDTRPGPPRSSGVSIGIGGGGYSGGYGGGIGLGGGVSIPIGKHRAHDLLVSGLDVTIRRRADGTTIWEGHAVTSADSASPDAAAPDAAADATARKLAAALFRGFPGESGRTITVK